MSNFLNCLNIKTRLGVCPTPPRVHDITVITRGATALLNFNLAGKAYTFDYVDQLTFSFKQDGGIHWYTMFNYLVETEDVAPVANKVYFTDVKPIDSTPGQLQHTGRVVPAAEVSANPKAAGYYEVIEGNSSWRDTIFVVDEHFYHTAGDGYDYVTFRFNSDETKTLELTTPDNNMQFEIAVRLNTEDFANYNGNDSIIIEPQHSIAVIDSLYTHI